MIWRLVLEICLYFVVALLIAVVWFAVPILLMRLALAFLYVITIRWAWRRGSD